MVKNILIIATILSKALSTAWLSNDGVCDFERGRESNWGQSRAHVGAELRGERSPWDGCLAIYGTSSPLSASWDWNFMLKDTWNTKHYNINICNEDILDSRNSNDKLLFPFHRWNGNDLQQLTIVRNPQYLHIQKKTSIYIFVQNEFVLSYFHFLLNELIFF